MPPGWCSSRSRVGALASNQEDCLSSNLTEQLPALAVPPREAAAILRIGETTLQTLLNSGELASFRIGTARRISTDSIRQYVARQIAAAHGDAVARVVHQQAAASVV